MVLTQKDVENIASLARLELTESEKTLYKHQLSTILEYVERLKELDIEDVTPTTSAIDQHSIMREDEVEPSLTLDEVLLNAPRTALNQFQIQAVLEEE